MMEKEIDFDPEIIYIRCTYICPIRATEIKREVIEEFYHYWDFLESLGCEVLVVDGSPGEVFDAHRLAWNNCRHINVDPRYKYLNGKVNGLMTAVPVASHEFIIIGDDDIRYTAANVERMIQSLKHHEVVRPQNYFKPLPPWARLDAARILLNRAYFKNGDFPGTYAFRKSVFLKAGPFDGDVLFDNEELIKHLVNFGAAVDNACDFFIQRKPPSFQKWKEQRPRQAYEDFVMIARTVFFLGVIPLHLLLIFSGKKKWALLLALAITGTSILKAHSGRSNGAKDFFPKFTPWLAPLWILERSISIYLAIYWKFTRGGYPFGDKIIAKGTGDAWKKDNNLFNRIKENASMGIRL